MFIVMWLCVLTAVAYHLSVLNVRVLRAHTQRHTRTEKKAKECNIFIYMYKKYTCWTHQWTPYKPVHSYFKFVSWKKGEEIFRPKTGLEETVQCHIDTIQLNHQHYLDCANHLAIPLHLNIFFSVWKREKNKQFIILAKSSTHIMRTWFWFFFW